MNSKRPINLNLWRLKFPVMAIASILHRISGVVIFLCLPLFMYLLHQSLISQESFDSSAQLIATPGIRFILWIALSALLYHLYAGIRHLVMDLGYGESLYIGRMTAYIVIILSVITSLFLGVWLWQI